MPHDGWLSSVATQGARDRDTVRDAWPAIKAGIDAGKPSMIGLVRLAGWNPLAPDFGHQVVGYEQFCHFFRLVKITDPPIQLHFVHRLYDFADARAGLQA